MFNQIHRDERYQPLPNVGKIGVLRANTIGICQRHCTNDPCQHHSSFVDPIETEEVVAATQELLARAREGRV